MLDKLRVLTVIKPYNGAVQTVGSLWVGTYLSNALVKHPDVEKVGVATKLPNYDAYDPNITIHELSEFESKSINKIMLTEASDIYQKYDYNIMHIHVNTLSSLKWFQAIIPSNVNVVYTLHNPSMLGRSKIIYGQEYASKLNNAKNYRIVALSKYNEDIWREFSYTDKDTVINNLSIIYNGIVEYPDIPLVPIEKRDKVVCACSRITPVKNTLKVLEMLSKHNIPSIYIGNYYNITKPGVANDEDEYIKECLDILNTSKNIKWYHDITNKEVLEIMSKCYLTIHMPVTEAFALVPLESMYVGTPVMYSNFCQPVVEQMTNTDTPEQVGELVEFRPHMRSKAKYELVAAHIQKVFDNPRDPEVVKKYYMDNYKLDLMVNKHIELYKSF